MRKTKLTPLLMAICCVFACLGIVTLVNQPKNVAKAANDFTITSTLTVAPAASNAKHISAYPTVFAQKPSPACGWQETFTFVTGTGEGFTINDEPVTGYEIKQPNDFEIELPSEAQAGDVVVIDGKFAGSAGNSITFHGCSLSFDGTAWSTVVNYTEYNVGKVSFKETLNAEQAQFYFKFDSAVPAHVPSWDVPYTVVSGITINGETVTPEIKVVDPSTAYVKFATKPEKDDVLVIEGTFECPALSSKIVIEKTELTWNGTFWGEAVESVVYTDHNLGKLTFHPNTSVGGAKNVNSQLHLISSNGGEIVDLSDTSGWGPLFTLESGDGLKVNDQTVNIKEVKSPGFLFFLFDAVPARSVVTIEGSFICPTEGIRYIVEKSSFFWNGAGWTEYDSNREYAEFSVGAVSYSGSYAGHPTFFDFALASGEQFPLPEGAEYANADAAWARAYAVFSGLGFTLNGTEITPLEIKFPNQMFINFATAPVENDRLVIEGVFYCDSVPVLAPDPENEGSKIETTIAIKYEIARSEFIWTGSEYLDIFTYVKIQKKAELDVYLAGFEVDNYYDEEWEVMEQIVADAKIAIDLALDAEEVDSLVEGAKEELGEVYTKEELDAIIGEKRTEAKAELDAYVDQENYKDAEWAEIQAIIAAAKETVDASNSLTAIANVVASAKASIDEVKTAAEVDAEALATAKDEAKAEVRAYYNALDTSLYGDDANAQLTAYVTEANAAIDAATTIAEVESIVADFKADVDSVEKIQPSANPSTGCGASVASGMVTLVPVLALAVCMIIRKKREI